MQEKSELLSQLLDCELGSNEESSMFSELASNEDLRMEFRELMNIKDSVKADVEAYSVPVEATIAVFKNLGMNSTLNSGSAAATKPFIKRFLLPAVMAVFVALISSGLIAYYYEGEIAALKTSLTEALASNKPSEPIVIEKIVKVRDNSIDNINKSGFVSSRLNSRFFSGNHSTSHSRNNLNSAQKNSAGNETDLALINSSFSNSKSDRSILTKSDFSSNSIKNRNYNIQHNDQYKLNYASLPEFPTEEFKPDNDYSNETRDNMSFQVRGISGTSFPNVDRKPHSPFVSNISAGFYLLSGSHHAFGFEVGQEPFGQVFRNVQDGNEIEVEQNPMLYWICASYKYTFNQIDFLGGLQPYAQVFGGFTELGPLAKTVIGLQYLTGNGFGFNFGIEGSALFYENQNQRYNTNKLGFTYGVLFNF